MVRIIFCHAATAFGTKQVRAYCFQIQTPVPYTNMTLSRGNFTLAPRKAQQLKWEYSMGCHFFSKHLAKPA